MTSESFEKVVLVCRKTRLKELLERFCSIAQARFYLEHSGADFHDYDLEDKAYEAALASVRAQVGRFPSLKLQVLDRAFVPSYLFSPRDLIVVVGQDGLVANTAKYVGAQPIIGVNPDPGRFDGILSPVSVCSVGRAIQQVLRGEAKVQEVALAEAVLNDGQRLLAFNDLFIGAASHVSARYQICYRGLSESHSSSGVIVSTGAGSTGWLSSIFNMVSAFGGGGDSGRTSVSHRRQWQWDERLLAFVVREPFVCRHSSASVVIGTLAAADELLLESRMPAGGVIFSDGCQEDALSFNSGATARIRVSDVRSALVMPGLSR